jgi:dihydroflavonol-4-reductase
VIFAITGANGFLGVHIIHHLLKQGHIVRAIIRPAASQSEFEKVKSYYGLEIAAYDNLSWHECELYDIVGLEEVLMGADYIMHLAGVISYLKRDFKKLISVNQGYTANVVNVALSVGVKKLLYCSSIAAIAKKGGNHTVTEDAEWDNELPHSNYGYTKYLGECELWRAQQEGLDVVIINPGIILGFGDWSKGSNQLFKNAATEFPFYSKGITGWVGVQDVALVAEQLCLSSITGERYIVVSQNRSYQDMAYAMADAFGVKRPRIEIKGFLYKCAYYLVALKEKMGLGGMLSKETVKSSIATNHFDHSKINKAIKVKFQDMDVVVRDAVTVYKKRQLLR